MHLISLAPDVILRRPVFDPDLIRRLASRLSDAETNGATCLTKEGGCDRFWNRLCGQRQCGRTCARAHPRLRTRLRKRHSGPGERGAIGTRELPGARGGTLGGRPSAPTAMDGSDAISQQGKGVNSYLFSLKHFNAVQSGELAGQFW